MLEGYGSDSDDSDAGGGAPVQLPAVNPAPSVVLPTAPGPEQAATGQKQLVLRHNLPVAGAVGPALGPRAPGRQKAGDGPGTLTAAGARYEPVALGAAAFDQQFNAFRTDGVAETLSGRTVGDKAGLALTQAARREGAARAKRKRLSRGDAADVDGFRGSWGGSVEELAAERLMDAEARRVHGDGSEDPEDAAAGAGAAADDADADADMQPAPEPEPDQVDQQDEIPQARSQFHGRQARDYQGRAWCARPPGLRADDEPGDHACFAPKRMAFKFNHSSKGASTVRFVPRFGHLLLSAGMDGKAKVYDLPTRRLQRTYDGHGATVRAAEFAPAGDRFLSCAHDGLVRLWDVETGAAVRTWRRRAANIAWCDDDRFLLACADNTIVQLDARDAALPPQQTYDHHLSGVNDVAMIDAQRFVSAAADQKVMLWQLGFDVPSKTIAEPHLFAVTTLAVHPTTGTIAGQSMDNQIIVYSDQGKNSRKRLAGHRVGGGCQAAFSPDGKLVIGGDAGGSPVVWDWRSGRQVQRLDNAHDKACVGVAWSPLEPSVVATCGWDGLVKVWA